MLKSFTQAAADYCAAAKNRTRQSVPRLLILGILGNGMQLIGMNTYAQYVVKGLVLLAAVGFDTFQKAQAQKVRRVA